MSLSVGIVGLPNVGKSTLFNALLKKQVADVANYPFCTIEPNVGVVEVPDNRLPTLAKIVKTEKIVPTAVEFYDIAGLVKGASQGEGLGNKFLAHIREVDAIIHVVRLFPDPNVTHVNPDINPVDDIEVIETELILADLATLEKQVPPKGATTKEELAGWSITVVIREGLNQGLPVRKLCLTDKDKDLIKHLNLLTLKPVLYVFNIAENQVDKTEKIGAEIKKILHDLKETGTHLSLCAKLEDEMAGLAIEEQREFLESYGLKEPGLNRLINKAYELLGLISFLTAGEKEVRAWTIKHGTKAPQAAGVIHSDFETHFIRADVIPYDDFIRVGGWGPAREHGLVRTVGKEYEIQEGEVVEFKVGV